MARFNSAGILRTESNEISRKFATIISSALSSYVQVFAKKVLSFEVKIQFDWFRITALPIGRPAFRRIVSHESKIEQFHYYDFQSHPIPIDCRNRIISKLPPMRSFHVGGIFGITKPAVQTCGTSHCSKAFLHLWRISGS